MVRDAVQRTCGAVASVGMRRHGKARLCGSRCKSGTRTVSPEAEAATGGWLCQDAAATSDEPLPPVSGLEGDGESDAPSPI